MARQKYDRFCITRCCVLIVVSVLLAACQPSDRTPGQWLRGEVVAGNPDDWRFSDEHREIYVEVATPYLVPHSVTVWCATVDGALYIGARNPTEKRWVGWMLEDRNVRLKIGEKIYEVATAELAGEDELARLKAAYVEKYQLTPPAPGETPPPIRYWRIVGRG